MKTQYTLGFYFDESFKHVALIRKDHPEWQAGKLNGIGGKIEDETMLEAMSREFKEEAGLDVPTHQWKNFGLMHGGSGEDVWSVHLFAAKGDTSKVHTTEREVVEIVDLSDVHLLRSDLIENLAWLICLAADSLHDGRPMFTTAVYP